MRPRPHRPAVLALLVLAAALSACSSGDNSAKLTRELLTMPKEEAYAKGEQLIAQKKWDLGRQYLRFVAENYANDPIGRQAALKLADSYFDEGTALGYLEAQARYKDFRNRYPSSPRADYALFRLAQTADKEAEKPDREQTNTRLAASSYRELIVGYPDSPYLTEARVRLLGSGTSSRSTSTSSGGITTGERAGPRRRDASRRSSRRIPTTRSLDRVLYELGAVERKLGKRGEGPRELAAPGTRLSGEPVLEEDPAPASRVEARPEGRGSGL